MVTVERVKRYEQWWYEPAPDSQSTSQWKGALLKRGRPRQWPAAAEVMAERYVGSLQPKPYIYIYHDMYLYIQIYVVAT